LTINCRDIKEVTNILWPRLWRFCFLWRSTRFSINTQDKDDLILLWMVWIRITQITVVIIIKTNYDVWDRSPV
jgi:hypothetical protein